MKLRRILILALLFLLALLAGGLWLARELSRGVATFYGPPPPRSGSGDLDWGGGSS